MNVIPPRHRTELTLGIDLATTMLSAVCFTNDRLIIILTIPIRNVQVFHMSGFCENDGRAVSYPQFSVHVRPDQLVLSCLAFPLYSVFSPLPPSPLGPRHTGTLQLMS